MTIVVDASVLANAIADDGRDGQKARDAIRAAETMTAPDLIDVETVSVLRKRWQSRSISDERFQNAVRHLEQLDFERIPTLRMMRRAYELRANVTAYDAAYVALAEALGYELVTADRRLANASGVRCVVRVLS